MFRIRSRFFGLWLLLASTLLAQAEPPPVRALFLGDRGHHRPEQRWRESRESFLAEGVELNYTEDLAALTTERLEPFDALLVYANLESLPAAAMVAVLDFVRSGKGFVPLHCASACCPSEPAWTALVGGQFDRHGFGLVRATVADPSHACLRGFMPFASPDETYVHRALTEDRHVLQWRTEGEEREPWTWVRADGKGRVFYTASGHDERTWSHPGFIELVTRGIRWAAGDRFSKVPAPYPQLQYFEAEIPTYGHQGEERAARGKPKGLVQGALSVEDSMSLAAVPPGFELRCFAAEPNITNPTAMAFDARGRLWITETLDYPNELKPQGEGSDPIKICTDQDGDGTADGFSIFATGLSIPSSLVLVKGGVIVTAQPDTLLLLDRDGDDQADERRVLFTGWGKGDTHAGPSNLRWGQDGWIYGTVGYSGFRGRVGTKEHRFGSGVFRFLPDGSELEFLGSSSNNTWGLGLSESGEIFYSTANNDVFNHVAIKNRLFERVDGWHAQGTAFIADYREMHPATEDVRQVDWHGRYTAAAGASIYTARAFPPNYWNRIAFVCEPTGHLIGQTVIAPEGSGFVARDGFNLFESRDAWTSPVAAEIGPDGAVWFIDWYSPVIQHNPTPHGFETGPGAAYVTALRDQERARIYRIVRRGTSDRGAPALRTPDDWLTTLEDQNLLWRQHAQRLILENPVPEMLGRVATRLTLTARSPSTEASVLVSLIATLGCLAEGRTDEIAPVLLPLLMDARPEVRVAALTRLLPTTSTLHAILAAKLTQDSDLWVRRHAWQALSEVPAEERLGELAWKALGDESNARDRWLPLAITAAAVQHAEGFLVGALSEPRPTSPAVPDSPNLLPNPSFSASVDSPVPAAPPWRVRTYGGQATHRVSESGRSGDTCLEISSETGSDTSYFVDVKVEPKTTYRLSGWIRTQGLKTRGGALGALLNVHGRSPAEGATTVANPSEEWNEVELTFATHPGETEVSINCLFGGWGFATGTAWFDDVKLTKIGSGSDEAARAVAREQALRLATRALASAGVSAAWANLLPRLSAADERLRHSILGGLASGWPKGKSSQFSEAERNRLRNFESTLDTSALSEWVEVTRAWSDEALISSAVARVRTELQRTLSDTTTPQAARLKSLGRLLRLEDSAENRAKVRAELSPLLEPTAAKQVLDLLAKCRADENGPELVALWPELTPSLRQHLAPIFLKRPAWQQALAEALLSGTTTRAELGTEVTEKLILSLPADLADRLRNAATNHAVAKDRQAALDRLLPLIGGPGDPARGRQLFRTLCSSCHQKDGLGAAVAPALDGLGSKAHSDLLLEIVDPNRSVEATYQLWLAFTKEGESFSGRMLSESRTTIELQDSGDVRHVIPREAIDTLRATNRSLMPEGLIDHFSADDLRSLLTYLTGK